MKKNERVAAKIGITIIQIIAIIISLSRSYSHYFLYTGKSSYSEYNSLYSGGFPLLGGIYAVCTVALIILLWTDVKIYLYIAGIQLGSIILFHITSSLGRTSILELGIAHLVLIIVSFVLVVFSYSNKDETKENSKRNINELSGRDMKTELEKLKELYEENLITQEEYDKKRSELLKL